MPTLQAWVAFSSLLWWLEWLRTLSVQLKWYLKERWRQIDGEDIRVFANITPEFASPLGKRSVAQRARSVVVSTLPDAVLISGPMAGSEPDVSILREAKEAIGGEMPLFLNTGATKENISQFLPIADGVIVGSSLKVGGYTWNPVDPGRVEQFMEKVKGIRNAWSEKTDFIN